jgi:hypothetical protein
MNDQNEAQLKRQINERRETFERNNKTYSLNLLPDEVEILIRHYCDLNERACIDFDAGPSDFRYYHDRCYYFSSVSGISGRTISQDVKVQLKNKRLAKMHLITRFLCDPMAIANAERALATEGVEPTDEAINYRVLRGRLYLILSAKAIDVGEDSGDPAIQNRLLVEAEEWLDNIL